MSPQQPPENKIIRIPTADGEFGICWRTMGVQVVIGTPVAAPGALSVPQPQPIPVATAAPCIGKRCTAWNQNRLECVFVSQARISALLNAEILEERHDDE